MVHKAHCTGIVEYSERLSSNQMYLSASLRLSTGTMFSLLCTVFLTACPCLRVKSFSLSSAAWQAAYKPLKSWPLRLLVFAHPPDCRNASWFRQMLLLLRTRTQWMQASKQRKAYFVRHHDGKLCEQRQPGSCWAPSGSYFVKSTQVLS